MAVRKNIHNCCLSIAVTKGDDAASGDEVSGTVGGGPRLLLVIVALAGMVVAERGLGQEAEPSHCFRQQMEAVVTEMTLLW